MEYSFQRRASGILACFGRAHEDLHMRPAAADDRFLQGDARCGADGSYEPTQHTADNPSGLLRTTSIPSLNSSCNERSLRVCHTTRVSVWDKRLSARGGSRVGSGRPDAASALRRPRVDARGSRSQAPPNNQQDENTNQNQTEPAVGTRAAAAA
eukprot:4340873-Pleurochrysis_carterae.AAC.4